MKYEIDLLEKGCNFYMILNPNFCWLLLAERDGGALYKNYSPLLPHSKEFNVVVLKYLKCLNQCNDL